MKKRVAELFAGVGGFRVGLDRLNSGWDFVYANQWEPGRKNQYAYDNYVKHFGESPNHSNLDINKVDKTKIPDIDLLVGGFPCQDYSVAHSGAKGIEGKKGVLWWDIRDTIVAKQPAFVLLENVDRLLTSPGPRQLGRDFGMILYTLNQLGYDAQWQMVNAADYGFPQRRRRVFIIAYRCDTQYAKKIEASKNLSESLQHNGIISSALPMTERFTREGETQLDGYIDVVDFSDNFSFRFESTGITRGQDVFTAHYEPKYDGPYETLNDIVLNHADDEWLYLDEDKKQKFEYLKGAKHEERTTREGFKYYYTEGAMVFPDPLDRPARTMLTSEHSVNRSTHVVRDKENGKLRLLAPIEAERLQTFPDGWTEGMPETSRYFMMGNALVTGVITKIGESLDEIFQKESSVDDDRHLSTDEIRH